MMPIYRNMPLLLTCIRAIKSGSVSRNTSLPKAIDEHKANQRLAGLLSEIPKIFGIDREQIFLKIRRKQKSTDQYEKQDDQGHFHIIEEGGCKLLVNFEDYLDTGLFLDHRPIRLLIQQPSQK